LVYFFEDYSFFLSVINIVLSLFLITERATRVCLPTILCYSHHYCNIYNICRTGNQESYIWWRSSLTFIWA